MMKIFCHFIFMSRGKKKMSSSTHDGQETSKVGTTGTEKKEEHMEVEDVS